MGLSETKRIFFEIRGECTIFVKSHAFKDYPERGFSQAEVISLVRNGVGRFQDNKSATAIPNSFLFHPKDDLGRECQLVILIEVVEVECDGEDANQDKQVVVCSAYREIK